MRWIWTILLAGAASAVIAAPVQAQYGGSPPPEGLTESQGAAFAKGHYAELDALPDEKAMLNRLCELNVIRQVRNVASDVFVQDAWARGQPLSVHGWVYSLGNGLVTDLNVGISSLDDYERVASGPC